MKKTNKEVIEWLLENRIDEQVVNGRIFQDEERVIQDCQDIKSDNNVNLLEEDIKGIK